METVEEFQILNSGKGLDQLRLHLEKIASSWNLSGKQLVEINLIIEEIYSNYTKHVEDNRMQPVEIRLNQEKDTLVITISDHGPEFDPTETTDPDVTLPIDQRKPGGLGLYLVRHYADSISYTRTENTNRLQIVKKLN
jgi:serine/threonine-protein kinase RsbW